MAESDVDELWVFAKFVVADHVEYLDTAGDGGADEEFVAFGRELNSLTSALGVEGVEQAWWTGGDIHYDDAIVVDV